jgi:Amt family ammonium transporter
MKTRFSVSLAVAALVALAALAAPQSGSMVPAGTRPDSGDTAWMLTSTCLVLLMTPGLSFFYGGMVSRKNVISTMLQSFIALGVVSLIWVVFGFSLAFGESWNGLIGNPLTYFLFRNVGASTHPDLSPTIPLVLFAMYQLKFAVITPALITGSFAERVRFSAYLLFMALFTVFVYTPLAHWTWHPQGFLHKWGVLDFAGGTVVHMSAGIAALTGALYLGPRRADLANGPQVASNIPYVLLGTGLLWFGWFGFNAGSALGANASAAAAVATTNTASAAAMLTWILLDAGRDRRPSALGACIGAVVGLVAITPAAGYVTVGHSIFIGALAALICNVAVHLKAQSTLDDTLDVFPCHGMGGIVGMLATGFLARDVGLFYGPARTMLIHLAALAIVGVFVFAVSWALYWLTDRLITLRVTPIDEAIGLDISQHNEFLELNPFRQYGNLAPAPEPEFGQPD